MRRRSFLCLCFRIFFRRFFTTLAICTPSLPVEARNLPCPQRFWQRTTLRVQRPMAEFETYHRVWGCVKKLKLGLSKIWRQDTGGVISFIEGVLIPLSWCGISSYLMAVCHFSWPNLSRHRYNVACVLQDFFWPLLYGAGYFHFFSCFLGVTVFADSSGISPNLFNFPKTMLGLNEL